MNMLYDKIPLIYIINLMGFSILHNIIVLDINYTIHKNLLFINFRLLIKSRCLLFP